MVMIGLASTPRGAGLLHTYYLKACLIPLLIQADSSLASSAAANPGFTPHFRCQYICRGYTDAPGLRQFLHLFAIILDRLKPISGGFNLEDLLCHNGRETCCQGGVHRLHPTPLQVMG